MDFIQSFVNIVYSPSTLLESNNVIDRRERKRKQQQNHRLPNRQSSSSSTSYSSSSSSYSSSEDTLKKRKKIQQRRPRHSSSSFESSLSSSLSSTESSNNDNHSREEEEYEESSKQKQLSITSNSMMKINDYMERLSKRYHVQLDFLQGVYSTFNQIPFKSSERSTLLCGLSQMISDSSIQSFSQLFMIPDHHNNDNKEDEDDDHRRRHKGCVFFNIRYPEDHNKTIEDDIKSIYNDSVGDTFLVDTWKHYLFSYIITHALFERIINLPLLESSLKLTKMMISILRETLVDLSILFHANNDIHNLCTCRKKEHRRPQSQCINRSIVYTKKTSKFFKWIEKMKEEEDEDSLLFGNCQIYSPLPFYLVLFLCGKSQSFRSKENMKEEEEVEWVSIQTSNILSKSTYVDTYIDYDKWVCVPSYYFMIYENLAKSSTYL